MENPTPLTNPGRRARGHGVIAVLSLIWGSTYFVVKQSLADLPPFTAAALRFGLAAGIMLVVARVLAAREGGRAPGWRLSLVMGVLNFALSYGIVYQASTVLPSGLVSVLWATFPMMVALAAHGWLPDERLGGARWSGFVVGFLGVVLLFLTDLRGLGTAAVPAGLMLLVSPLSAAVGNTLVKRHATQVSSLLLNRNGMVVGAALLGLAALLTEDPSGITWTPWAVFSVLYLACVGTVLTFSLYFWALRTVPAHRLSLIAYVTPLLALTLGALGRAEPVGGTTVMGTCGILVGVGLVLRRPRVAREAPTQAEGKEGGRA